MNSGWPPLDFPSPPGNCTECVTSKTTGIAEFAHDRKRAHIHDEILIAEGSAALGEDDFLVAGAGDFFGSVAHFPGREKLAFFDVHDAAGAAGGEQADRFGGRGNAGICSTSQTSAAGPTCETS